MAGSTHTPAMRLRMRELVFAIEGKSCGESNAGEGGTQRKAERSVAKVVARRREAFLWITV